MKTSVSKMETSSTQFEMLITFMEKNGDLSKPTSDAKEKMRCLAKWDELQSLLNSDPTGEQKSIERWQKVWSDFKNNTKRKAVYVYRAVSGNGGVPVLNLKLSDLEQRVLSLINCQVAIGLTGLEAAGVYQNIDQNANPKPITGGYTPVLSVIDNIWYIQGPSGRPYTPQNPGSNNRLFVRSYNPPQDLHNVPSPVGRSPEIVAQNIRRSLYHLSPEYFSQNDYNENRELTPRLRSRVLPVGVPRGQCSDEKCQKLCKEKHEKETKLEEEQLLLQDMDIEIRDWISIEGRLVGAFKKIVNKIDNPR